MGLHLCRGPGGLPRGDYRSGGRPRCHRDVHVSQEIIGSDTVLYIEPPTDRTVGSLYGTTQVWYGPHLLGIRPRKGEMGLVARPTVLLLAMIRQGYTHVSALLPSGNSAPHQSYCRRRERSVAGILIPSLSEPILLPKRNGERSWPGSATKVRSPRVPMNELGTHSLSRL
jgi:hypothetical protein